MAGRAGAKGGVRSVVVAAERLVPDQQLHGGMREHLGVDRWSLLGQSFGGFCALNYLSRFPDSLAEVMFSGGVPPVGLSVDEIYAATYERTAELVERHYARFPGDRDAVRRIVEASRDLDRYVVLGMAERGPGPGRGGRRASSRAIGTRNGEQLT